MRPASTRGNSILETLFKEDGSLGSAPLRLDALESGLAFVATEDMGPLAALTTPVFRPIVLVFVVLAPPKTAPAVLGLVPTFPLPLGATRNLLSFSLSTVRSSIPSSSVPSPNTRTFFGLRMGLAGGGEAGAWDEDEVGRCDGGANRDREAG